MKLILKLAISATIFIFIIGGYSIYSSIDINSQIQNELKPIHESEAMIKDIQLDLEEEFHTVKEYVSGSITKEQAEEEIEEIEEAISQDLIFLDELGVTTTDLREIIEKEDELREELFEIRSKTVSLISEFNGIVKQLDQKTNEMISATKTEEKIALLELRVNLEEEFSTVKEYVSGSITKEQAEEEIEEIEEAISQDLIFLDELGVTTTDLREIIEKEDELREELFKNYDIFLQQMELFDSVTHEIDEIPVALIADLDLQRQKTNDVLLSTSTNNIFIILAVTVGSIIISVLTTGSMLQPIKKLKKGADDLAKGEFIELEVSGNDELTDLTKSFNKMSTEIYQSKIIITENLASIKKQKKKLDSAFLELRKSDLLKEEFASMVTHELKTPLTPIRGYCEMLTDESFGTLTENQLDYVKKIESSAWLLERLIGDVLDVQKLDMDRMHFNKVNIDIDAFLDKFKQDSNPLMMSKGIEFFVADSLKTSIQSDELRLHQVLDNLVRNSVDFVPSTNGKIEVGAKQENGKMIFHVKDNGVGIAKDKQKNIFKKFYQVDTSQTRKHGGSGLGLVICKGIVNGLGGEIWFESEPGKGTKFSFDIPVGDN